MTDETRVTRVLDVYGKRHWVATRHLENKEKIMLAICNGKGEHRCNTRAGDDGMNMLHRDNIKKILQMRYIR